MLPRPTAGGSSAIVPVGDEVRGLDLWEPSGWSGGQLVVVGDDTRGRGQVILVEWILWWVIVRKVVSSIQRWVFFNVILLLDGRLWFYRPSGRW